MTATILLSVLTLIAILAPRYGADSRSLRERPHYTATPWGDVKKVLRRLEEAAARPQRAGPAVRRLRSGTPSGSA
ncbi:hypothetical protein ACFQH9_24830 [Pseudonocardia lutea]|jgi:hypothetical protein|uniref:Uncharacterized protein n=1 Tax=Pseudonocardia lutea TaxID=2172015 RepID=A0ABW1IGW9_9PSEU